MGRKLFKIQALEKQEILNVSLNGLMDRGHNTSIVLVMSGPCSPARSPILLPSQGPEDIRER